jgi:hypothetical protein
LDWDPVSADHKDVRNSGLAVVSKINNMLKESGISNKCAKLKLGKIKSAILVKSKIGEDDQDSNAGILKGKLL